MGCRLVMVHFAAPDFYNYLGPRGSRPDNQTMPRKDFSQVALDVVRQATGEQPKPAPSPKKEASRKGGLKGGSKRMADMTPEQRKELALKAAGARWSKSAPSPSGTGARKR